MDCDTPKYHDAVALQNTWFLLQKSDFALQFAREWLKYNLDERIASYVMPDTCGLPPLKGFVENRGDQSIFSNLAVKYEIKTFFGEGWGANRNVNLFIPTIPKNAFQKAVRSVIEVRRKFRRRNYLAKTPPDQLCGKIPQELRDHGYLGPQPQGPGESVR
jgi:hypothetical protein